MERQARHPERGVTLLELVVGSAVAALVFLGVSALLVQGSKSNKREMLRVETQGSARNCLARVVKILRSQVGPGDHGIATVALDPDPTDSISQIAAFIDRDGNGVTAGTRYEQIVIRHVGNRVEWTDDGSGAFRTLAHGITNDEDGDGTIEPMFIPDDPANPKRIFVRVTAQAPSVDPTTRRPIRYTLTDEVVLRKRL